MALFLVVQATYDTIELGLFSDGTVLATLRDEKKCASQNFVLLMDQLLSECNRTIHDVDAFGVNTGPAPFTSLRIVIATMNGLSFATKIPLIALDGLQLFLQEHASNLMPTVCFFNAYNNEVYYGMLTSVLGQQEVVEVGYAPLRDVFDKIFEKFHDRSVMITGSGIEIYQDFFEAEQRIQFYKTDQVPQHVSIEFLGQKMAEYFSQQRGLTYELFPNYLKELTYKKAL